MNIDTEELERLTAFDQKLARRIVLLQAQWDFALTLGDPVDRATAMNGIRDGHDGDEDWEDWRRFRDARLAGSGFMVGDVA